MTKSKGILIKDPVERFWRSASVPSNENECWIWTGRTSYKGYGIMKINNHSVQAHRFSYELHVGEIPVGMLVCHKCDNPPCVNPNHLFAGTVQENNLDRDMKGRKALGERNGKSKLTEKEVRKIISLFQDGISSSEIARRMSRPQGTINSIRVGRSWAWVK